ncbi:hypothetical protein DBV23_06565 [Edwardsiella ictaluri]|uniref:Uncharacterized protein n=1 Tax=Edwardsiella ictaluri (strain 93-146) TaxID=634503 RepID=C5BCV2_EDWI9|nr:hypothetical protein [Edwardsiella ictaluri]ACR67558.1 hypothetical protein NT01EI_0316 [Edwardsiella ictaluri 93-146]AVZ81966.1 hypothetical protein DBV23_06565 [Edwardsiella ictaluri]EKS7764746.1 hypothetical protein [Edwardsiella ictaluri]EKS7771617.1 hypothetical protein [Edwardsiella ictaluri]EKS7774786.1 hypothetical protein [Edwardsiella ictaluri]
MSYMTINAILAQRPERQPYIDGPEKACCQWQHGVDDRPNNVIVMYDEAHGFTVAPVCCRLHTGKSVWRIKPVQFFFNVIPEPCVAGWQIYRPFLCQRNGHFPERQFFDIGWQPAVAPDNGIMQGLHGRASVVLNAPVMGPLQPFTQPHQPEFQLPVFRFFLFSLTLETLADVVKFTFTHAQKFARQQFAIGIHIFSLCVMNINVLPAPSDQSRQTSWLEIVLSVSGIITLAIVCLAPFTFLHGLLVYSAISTVFWQHFHQEVCHG